MAKFVDGRATVVVYRDGVQWGAMIMMRLNEALRAQPGDVIELSAFSRRFVGKCRIPSDWKRSSNSITSSDPLFYVVTRGEGPLQVDGQDIVPNVP